LSAYTSTSDLRELEAIAQRSDSGELAAAVDRARTRRAGVRQFAI